MQPPRVTHAADVAALDLLMSERIDACTSAIKQFSDREESVQTSRDALAGSLPDIENFRKRLSTAIQRAADENRWPVKIASREFTRDQAIAIETRLDDYVAKTNASLHDCDRAITEYDAAIQSEQQIRDQLRSHQAHIEAGFSEQEFDDIRAQANHLSDVALAEKHEISNPVQMKPVDLEALLK